ncbi:hypothetical protein AMS68_004669 [Peltaster fructicola]|uniref:Uncharacterized protein n=1 Tax=Peltaster fructicola TaxID=286661 RepID=A0A6H0XWJ9_9PEZI|nr:hypothetical protein AMS68_004669 [Peltaster fructicola]
MAAPVDQIAAGAQSTNDMSATTQHMNDQRATFTAETALFLPTHLQVSRPARAWERKATSAFVNGKAHTRRIWRRAVSAPTGIQRALSSQTIPCYGSPNNAKRVKRRCVSSQEAVNTQWDVLSSPVKRITTRSALAKELIALPENEELETVDDDADVEGTVFAIIHENGTVTTLDEAPTEDAEDWQDEEEYNDTLMHLEDAVTHESTLPSVITVVEDREDGLPPTPGQASITAQNGPGESMQARLDHNMGQTAITLPTCTIPAGFISPMKRYRSVSKRLREAGRRRTLPQAFAPVVQPPEAQTQKLEPVLISTTTDPTCNEPSLVLSSFETSEALTAPSDASEEAWEDVDAVEAIDSPSDYEQDISVMEAQDGAVETVATFQDSVAEPSIQCAPQLSTSPTRTEAAGAVRTQRSSRRKSSSPIKSRKAPTSQETMHIIAFTPIKKPAVATSPLRNNGDTVPFDDSPTPSLVPQTPPSMLKQTESSQMQTRRSDRSRLSDDTALLQAFIDRAAQNKQADAQYDRASTVISAQDDGCQDATPPVSPGILFELDPNTSSPRKVLASPATEPESAVHSTGLQDSDDIDGIKGDASSRIVLGNKDVRRSERIMTTAPAKITLRGVKENLGSKRTPAQELFMLTGKNTRANRADAVPPSQRVPELMMQLLDFSSVTQQPLQKSTKKKTVTWVTTPIYFSFDHADSEEHEHGAETAETSDTAAQTDTPQAVAIEPLKRRATPGKPRNRQLRAPSAPTALNVSLDETQTSSENFTGRKSFRSSIATPVKRMSLAAPEKRVASKSGIPSITNQLGTQRKMQSRLPAPVSVLDTSSVPMPTSSNASITSPPKRRASLFIPNFEADAAKVDVAAKSTQASGLTSPAKKPRRALVFGSENQAGKADDMTLKLRDTPSFSSPAKKRARRVC